MNEPRIESAAAHIDWLPSILVGSYMAFTSVAVFWLPIYFADELGFSGAQIGLLYAINAIAGVLAALPGGLGNDRLTSRALVIGALIVQSAMLVGLGGVHVFAAALVVFFAWSTANNLFRMSLEMQLLKTDTGARTGPRVGLFVGWRYGGLLAGTILAGYVLHWLDFRAAFRAAGAICVALLPAAMFLTPTRPAPVRWRDYFRDLSDRRVLLFAGWLFLFTMHWGVETTCYGLFLRRNLGLSMQQMGWYMSAEFAAVVAAAWFVGPRVGRDSSLTRLAIGGVALSGLGHIGMVAGNVWVSVAFRAIHGFGDGALSLLLYLGIAKLFHVDRLGGNAGALNLAMMSGQIAGAMIAGPLGQKAGYALPIWTSGALMVALSLPLVCKARRDRAARG